MGFHIKHLFSCHILMELEFSERGLVKVDKYQISSKSSHVDGKTESYEGNSSFS
jgi:hypothetical protein